MSPWENVRPLRRLMRLESVARSARRVVEACDADAPDLPAAVAELKAELQRLDEDERR